MSVIISSDDIKTSLPGYSPDKAEKFHHESASKADKLFSKVLRESRYKDVTLMSGGTASGKTEFLTTHLVKTDTIIFDATLSTELGAKNKIRQITKSGKNISIYSVVPDDLKRAFIAFLNRDRKFSDAYFYKTHSGSRRTLLWIASNYPDIQIVLIESSYTTEDRLEFTQLHDDDRQKQIAYLKNLQLSEDDIIKRVGFIE